MRCELDMDAGTLRYLVNGEDQGICFTNMNEFGAVYPAVAFYSSNRAVRLLSVECTNVSQPLFLSDTLTPIPTRSSDDDDDDEKKEEIDSSSKEEEEEEVESNNFILPPQAGTLGYRVRVMRDEEEENDQEDEEDREEDEEEEENESESKEEYENDPMIVVDEKRRNKAISLRPKSQGFVREYSRVVTSLTHNIITHSYHFERTGTRTIRFEQKV